jgi:DNA-binding CsgD family transcriptional regulator
VTDPSFPADLNDKSTSALSPRERQILQRIAAGQTNQEIAAELDLSVNTVNNHVASILEKLGQPSRAAAVAIAIRHRVI